MKFDTKNIVTEVTELIKMNDADILNDSALFIKFVRIFKLLFEIDILSCGSCQKDKKFLTEFKNKGMERAKLYDLQHNRTCKPAWNGIKQCIETGVRVFFIHADKVTDTLAIDLLKKGILKESDFEIFPENYIKSTTEIEIIVPKKPKKLKK